MKTMGRICAAMLLLGLAAACNRAAEPDEAFLASEDLCLIERGHLIRRYDPLTCQIGFSRSDVEFRVHNDRMSDFYILTLERLPSSEGEEIVGTVMWSGSSGITRRSDLTFKVEKLSSDGKVWLWNAGKQVAVSVRILD